MSRTRAAAILLLSGTTILVTACHSQSQQPFARGKTTTKAASSSTAALASNAPNANAPNAAPLDLAKVRPISRPVGATVAIAEIDHRHIAFVADEDESAIHLIDLDTKAIAATKRLEGMPGQLMLGPTGTLFVAVRGAGHVVAFGIGKRAESLHEIARHETGDEPFGLALTIEEEADASASPNRKLLVTTIGGAHLEAFRVKDLAPAFKAPLPRDPRSIAVTPDGIRAFVSHATGSVVSVVDLRSTAFASSGAIRSISLDERERRRDFGMEHITKPMAPPPPGGFGSKSMKFAPAPVRISMKRTANQGFALAMIGDKIYLPETLVMTGDTNIISTGYGSVEQSTLGTHIPFVARMRIEDEKIDNLEFSGPEDRTCFESAPECIVPRAMVDDGKNLYVACLDSNEVLVIDPAADAEHAKSCKKVVKERPRLKIDNPTGLAIDSDRKTIVAFSSFSRQLSVAPISEPAGAVGESTITAVTTTSIDIPRSAPLPDELVAEGQKLFHRSADVRIAENGRACASCHVDGRDDGLVWPTPIGKRQTPMLAGRIDGTAPYGWNGEHASLTLHIKSTLKNLKGKGLGDREIDALSSYLSNMRAPAKHMHTTDAVERGKTIFASNETGCSSCHIEDTRFTDHETHALDIKKGGNGGNGGNGGAKLFDTPSLAFVGQTAPYFHDGRFKTLEDLIEGCDGVMGKTKHLSTNDRQDLAAYLRSL